jgi:mutator protein MutT
MKKYVDVLIETVIDNSKVETKMNAAAAVIMKYDEDGNKQILLIQRAVEDHWPHHWEFPRGKCDNGKNENVVKCVKREVKEETGLDIKVLGLIDTFHYLADEGKRLTTCYNYLCKMKNEDQKVKLSKEHQDYQWVSEVGQIEMLVLPDQKKTIDKVLNSDRTIVNYPDNEFTQNNKIEEYLRKLQ